jgi:hypothetical protein
VSATDFASIIDVDEVQIDSNPNSNCFESKIPSLLKKSDKKRDRKNLNIPNKSVHFEAATKIERQPSNPLPNPKPLFKRDSHTTKTKSSITVSIRAKAERLAAQHEGKVNIADSGLDLLQFTCRLGHTFMRSGDELSEIPDMTRKASYCTMASSSATSSDDETMSEQTDSSIGTWCPKCEAFYKSCRDTAYSCNLKLVGKMFSDNLSFECLARGHNIPINQSKRINGFVSCTACRKENRE